MQIVNINKKGVDVDHLYTFNYEQFNYLIIKNILDILYQIYYLRPLKTDTISCPKAIYKATNLYGPEMENTMA